MQSGQPSRTAWAAAAHRAAHQVLEKGRIFSDPLAVPILGQDAESVAREAEARPSSGAMRLFIAARTRFAEDSLTAAVRQGAHQLVVLGAGLDTYAYRSPFGDRLEIFEVDHPATQAWKRERLADAAIPIPPSLTFAPIDFEHQTLPEGLAAAGFDPAQHTFFTWLGVVPYLTEEAIWSTLAFIASLSGGAHVVFDYSDPPHTLSREARTYHDRRASRVEAIGESWVSYFEADKLKEKLLSFGFTEVEDLGPPQIAARYIPNLPTPRPERGGHILRARKA
ncbi:MAG TPA: SAM-dependent methyltransferase [Verrucomicrobiae bacterium]|jgi:methyltransferase (TIGR00027 family)|nr:SAM-dependent methyltransferase [Verrucomicrobiae bacterium]